ncbi:hypothetical protein [Maricaulis sp.]|uniref:hypothetical protein n=1 Tax=Maricaulis sp. TaxID=1486257 RepID=UPI003A91DAC0
MSFSRIIPHRADGYVEAVFDGHEDWMSAVQHIEQIVALFDEMDVYRVLMDFRRVDMRVAVVEAPDVARLFHKYAYHEMSFGIIPPVKARGMTTVERFAECMERLGHTVQYLNAPAEIDAWTDMNAGTRRRAG